MHEATATCMGGDGEFMFGGKYVKTNDSGVQDVLVNGGLLMVALSYEL